MTDLKLKRNTFVNITSTFKTKYKRCTVRNINLTTNLLLTKSIADARVTLNHFMIYLLCHLSFRLVGLLIYMSHFRYWIPVIHN
jgi:hypothetical protein